MRTMNRDKYKNIKIFFSFFLLFTYMIFSPMYTLISPFIGVVFCYFIFNLKYFEEKKNYFYILTLYLLIFEINYDFVMFSSLGTCLFLYYMFIDENNPKQYNLKTLIFIFIVLFYVCFYLFNFLLSYMSGLEYPIFGFYYLRYILVDFIISLVLFL